MSEWGKRGVSTSRRLWFLSLNPFTTLRKGSLSTENTQCSKPAIFLVSSCLVLWITSSLLQVQLLVQDREESEESGEGEEGRALGRCCTTAAGYREMGNVAECLPGSARLLVQPQATEKSGISGPTWDHRAKSKEYGLKPKGDWRPWQRI